MVVKPNDKRSGKPLQKAEQGAAVLVFNQQLGGEFDQILVAVGKLMTPLIMRSNIWEKQLADQVVRSLGSLRQWSLLLLGLLHVLVRELSRTLPVCVRRFTNGIGGNRGLCFEVCFFS